MSDSVSLILVLCASASDATNFTNILVPECTYDTKLPVSGNTSFFPLPPKKCKEKDRIGGVFWILSEYYSELKSCLRAVQEATS